MWLNMMIEKVLIIIEICLVEEIIIEQNNMSKYRLKEQKILRKYMLVEDYVIEHNNMRKYRLKEQQF